MSETKIKTKTKRIYSKKSKKIEKPIVNGETSLDMNDIVPPGGAGPAIIDNEPTELHLKLEIIPKEKILMTNTKPITFLKEKISISPPSVKKNEILFMSDLSNRKK